VHPNTGDDERDHTQRAIWMGEKYPLDLSLFKRMKEMRAKQEAERAKISEKEEVKGN